MKTITIEYNERNKTARQFVEFILSTGIVRHRKTGLEEALEDAEKGNLRSVHVPKTRFTEPDNEVYIYTAKSADELIHKCLAN